MGKVLKRIGLAIGVVFLAGAILLGTLYWYLNPPVERQNGIVYGLRNGEELKMDLVGPRKPNGHVILFMVSGSWKSDPDVFCRWMVAPLLRSGYTVAAVSHVSQPKVSVQDTVADIHRAVRFVRFHAEENGLKPDQMGIMGASSGGHLSLMIATQGGPGDPDSPDPVERESSAVQAVTVFFPVTNLSDLGKSTENAGDGGPPKSYRKAFGREGTDLETWKVLGHALSPVYHVTKDLSPVLIVHGDADTLVPLEQSEWFLEAANKAGADVELQVRKGKEHGWLTMIADVRRFARWYDEQWAD